MEKLLLLLVVAGCAAVVIIMIYLISRVEKIEDIAINGPPPKGSLAQVREKEPWLGLQGVDLWDLLSGDPPPGYAKDDAQPWQPKYEHILYKHIETLFNRGMEDKKAAKLKEQPESPMVISTLRETMNAFMPNQYASVLYESGYEIVAADSEQRLAIIDAIDRTSETLFNKINVEHSGSMSARLVPPASVKPADQEDLSEQMDNVDVDAEDGMNFDEQTATLEKNLGRDLG
ncbi:MAG: hypothetical protein CBD08_005650 [Cellvibrionales bacterium TMED148]|nr:hypothetical protein [Porticoccaceae bacterium]RPG89754.1 MAG: hypothetical protein CBD08_005650 [Cellvibrionales bacterium TMED148]